MKNVSKFLATLALIGMSVNGMMAQTPVIIDVSTLGGTDADNSGNLTEAQWRYNSSARGLYLESDNGDYTLTGTNTDLCFWIFHNNLKVNLNGVNITSVTDGNACRISTDVTVTLIGTNYLEGNNTAIGISQEVLTITSLSGGSLTAKGVVNVAIACYSYFIIDGNADVIAESTSREAIYTSNNILMSDNAKLTMVNNAGSSETHTFEKLNQTSTYEWKLTNATTTDPLTNAVINVTVAAGQTGTIERVNPVPITYTITATAGANGSITPAGAIDVEEGEDQTFTFTANSGYEIDEVLIDGTNNPAAVTAGSYTFENVTAVHSIAVSFKETVGIVTITNDELRMTVYPNPTTGQLRITNYELRENTVIEIYDIYGKNVTPLTSHSSPLILDISHLANGMYFLKIDNKVVKVIKN